METYFVLTDGSTIKRTATKIPCDHGYKEKWYYCRDNKLYLITDFHKDYGIGTYSGRESETFIGSVDYVYTDKDIEDAKFLIKMEKYFPVLKPSKVSKVVKKLIKKLHKED